MDGFFSLATTGVYSTSITELRSLIDQQVQGHLTGVIHGAYSSGHQFALFLIQGTLINAYVRTKGAWAKIPLLDWLSCFEKTNSEVKAFNLPVEGIRVTKMLFECPETQGIFQLQTSDLARRFDGWSTSPETIVVQIQWPHAEAVLVFPGEAMPVQPVIFINDSQIATEKEALSAITSWKDPACTVSVFADHSGRDAWAEYRLHLIFTKTTELLLTRYNELAGKSLVSVLNQDVDDETLRRGWRISCVGNGILDHHIFFSPKEATKAYRNLLTLIQAHMETVVGRKISNAIIREVVEELGTNGQEVLRTYRLLERAQDANKMEREGNHE